MEDWYFEFSDFCITNDPVPVHIASKIVRFHMLPLIEVRRVYAKPIVISQKSCYRPIEYEKSRGRNGTSEHTFMGKGACDLVGEDLQLLLHLLSTITQYKRYAYYPKQGFIHVDHAGATKRFFIDWADGIGWKSVKNIEELSLLVKQNQNRWQ